jgi:hypothetical protein
MLERGELIAFDGTAHTATVRFAGSLSSVVAGVPVSRAIDGDEMVGGRRVAVALFAPGDPTDAMVIGVA